MNNAKHPQLRRGMSSMEITIALAITFPIAWTMYVMAQQSLGNLYHVISTMIGSPYF